jgi:urease alpha subunit
LTRDSLARNRATAPIEVDIADGAVSLEGTVLGVDPVRDVALSRRYFLR